ncbi:MAG: BamA/TamA family outer membrane protein [Steroidobacteraceae bacterium]
MRIHIRSVFAFVATALCCTSPAGAADPQPYRVDIASTGAASQDAILRATSDLMTLRSNAPVSPFGLIARARGDVDRLKTALESFGYYQSSVTIKINGLALSDPELAEALAALPAKNEARVEIGLALGPLYHVRGVTVDGELPASAHDVLPLKSGAPAVAADVVGAGAQLLAALEDQGYAFAKVDPPIAYEDQVDSVLDVTFHVEAGPRVRIGEIRLEGLKSVREKPVRRKLTLHTGDQYNSSAIEHARHDLLAMGVFSAITVQVGTAVDESGGVPITFQFRERPGHAVSVNIAYSSDLGGSGGLTWSDRNLFGNAQQLNVSASVLNVGGSATTGLGYDIGVKFIQPDFIRPDQSLQVAVGTVKQYLQAYDQTAVTSGVTVSRKLAKNWTVSASVTTADEQIIQEGATHDYTLLALPLSVSYDSTDLKSPLDDPRHGMRDSLSVAPTRSLGQTSATFLISQLKIAAYYDLEHLFDTAAGRSVLAARGLLGFAQGAATFSLPPDQRFYGGGSGTIRGYRYQSVGPQFADGTPEGGTAITAGSVEFRQRIGANWGIAVFADGGQVSASLRPLASTFYTGLGTGVRYYTPIGPVRFDIAVPTKHYISNGDPFEIYVGLGQAF